MAITDWPEDERPRERLLVQRDVADVVLVDLHRLGDHLADRLVAVGRDGADLGDFRGRRDGLGALLDVLDDGGHEIGRAHV